jgi:N-carbamoylputrescine amidase
MTTKRSHANPNPNGRRPAGADAARAVVVGLTQMECSDDPKQNLANQVRLVEQAAKQGAQIICTQELFRSQYFCQSEDHRFFKLAETIPGPSTDALTKLAKKHKAVIVASLFEKRTEGLYHNTAAVIDADGSIKGIYRKMHIPDDPLYYEKFYFTPGDLGFKVHDTSAGRMGVLVCWDQWFPEGARLTALQGAEILFYPTAIGWLPSESREMNLAQHSAWETIQRAHAIANGVFVAAVNRVGREGELTFWGQSFVADPFGRIIAKASSDREEILIVPIDRAKIEETRQNWPFLRDRRVDAYGGLGSRLLDLPAIAPR